MGGMAFICFPGGVLGRTRQVRSMSKPLLPKHTVQRLRTVQCVSAPQSPGKESDPDRVMSTEEVFAIDAGRDLFFPGMDEEMAIDILNKPLDELEQPDDRYIAAERLKFFPSEAAAKAIMSFTRRFDQSMLDIYVIEDKVSRRKAVESLARHKGAFLRDEVIAFLIECLNDVDLYLVEVAVWGLNEVDVSDQPHVYGLVEKVLDIEKVDRRVVIHTLLRAGYKPSLPRIESLMDCPNPLVASAAMSAIATLGERPQVMNGVIDILRSDNLNVRRAAIEDITAAKFVPALQQVAVCPNSLVLRARTARVLLDKRLKDEPTLADCLDQEMATILDRLIWDHPGDLDLLGKTKETKKARDVKRNVRQLYKNDALACYLASRTLAEDYRVGGDDEAGDAVLKSYNDLDYFDYFGAYHVYKTLGWLQYGGAYDLLAENAKTLPPRFFNHQVGAITALTELTNIRRETVSLVHEIAANTKIWEVKYACLLAAERLGDNGKLRGLFCDDADWLIRARCRNDLGFEHLRTSFD